MKDEKKVTLSLNMSLRESAKTKLKFWSDLKDQPMGEVVAQIIEAAMDSPEVKQKLKSVIGV